MKLSILIFFLVLFFLRISLAVKVHGRTSFGTMASTERFSDTATASDKNDFMVSSVRYYTKISEITNNRWHLVADLRDKNDFFDKLNREQRQLDNKNEFQTRQLNFGRANPEGGLNYEIGRFPVTEAGSVNADGLLLSYNISSALSSAVFAGLNPKRVDQTYLQWNPNSNIQGVYITYQSRDSQWARNFYFTNAYVNQTTLGETDRTYFFNSTSYQWELNSRILTLFYVDFAPRTNMQVGSLQWKQGYNKQFSTQLNLLGIDVIEYTRRQDVRERLDPSPYREGSLKFDYFSDEMTTWELGGLAGRREVDQKNKAQYHLGFFKNRIFGPKWDATAKVGVRKNFISDDQFVHLGLGYFSRIWEGNLDIDYANEKYESKSLQVLTTEISYSHYFSKAFYGTLSFLRAVDQEVQIYSGFFRIGYRWGSQEIPPFRDGAPPRGSL